ncbi:MAG TPA: hypothetical protein VF062_09500 [Candidatus Limnocylindrales bacterium]
MNSETKFRQSIRDLVAVVFTDDMEYFDSLSEKVERELGTPLAALIPMVDGAVEIGRITDAALLVEEIAAEIRPDLPADLYEVILAMGRARAAWCSTHR